MKGSGPFGEHPAGAFNFDPQVPQHVLYVERTPQRVRVLLASRTVADSDDVRLLHPPGRTPTYLFRREHVRTELLHPSERHEFDPGMGPRTYWSVEVGQRRAQDAAYSWEQPPASAEAIAGLIAFDWDSVSVFEEDEEVFVHPRDPYTRIDVLRTSRRVVVQVGDTVVADSTRPRMLLESGLPVRWYLSPEDVRTDLLVPSGSPSVQGHRSLLVASAARSLRAGPDLELPRAVARRRGRPRHAVLSARPGAARGDWRLSHAAPEAVPRLPCITFSIRLARRLGGPAGGLFQAFPDITETNAER